MSGSGFDSDFSVVEAEIPDQGDDGPTGENDEGTRGGVMVDGGLAG